MCAPLLAGWKITKRNSYGYVHIHYSMAIMTLFVQFQILKKQDPVEPHFSSPAPPCYIGIAQKHPSGKLTEVEFLFLNSGAFRRRFGQKNCPLTLTYWRRVFKQGNVLLFGDGRTHGFGDGHARGPGTAHVTGREKKKKAAQAPDRASHFTSRFVAVPWLSPRGPAKRVGFNSPGVVAQRRLL